jgi:uncharacterized membrane protein YgaE (UPF0421/DUF939 family)
MGIRVIKTALAALAAIYIAKVLGLEFYLSAGLLAVLGVDVTRKRSLLNAAARSTASILGLIIGLFIFWAGQFQIWTIALFIIVAYPLLSKMKLRDGIVTSSVMVFHIFSLGEVNLHGFLNEIWLLLIGFGSAALFNLLYMPKGEKELMDIKKRLEILYSKIFYEMGKHLEDPHYIWDGQEILDASRVAKEGNELAGKVAENMLFRSEEEWMIYYHMRMQQLDSIQRMLVLVAQVFQTLPHGKRVSEVFFELSEDVKNEFYTGRAEHKLLNLELEFKNKPLPETREEFENRSSLFQLLQELKQYLEVAKKEKKRREHPSAAVEAKNLK